jgi:hypothetical protein
LSKNTSQVLWLIIASILLRVTGRPIASRMSIRKTDIPSERFLHLVGGRRAGQQQHQVGFEGAARPDLLAVDDIGATVGLFGPGLQLRGVAAGVGSVTPKACRRNSPLAMLGR